MSKPKSGSGFIRVGAILLLFGILLTWFRQSAPAMLGFQNHLAFPILAAGAAFLALGWALGKFTARRAA